jgi:transposase, IS6 family
MTEQHPFTWRHFQSDIILQCMRWYLRYSLSYRYLEEIMLERDLHVDHTTMYHWVQHYAPTVERRCRPHLNATNDSWRVDETSIKGATRTWLLALSEAKEVHSLVGFRSSPKGLMATGVAFG